MSLSSIIGPKKEQSTNDDLNESIFKDIEINKMKIVVNNKILQLEPEMRDNGDLLEADKQHMFEVQKEA